MKYHLGIDGGGTSTTATESDENLTQKLCVGIINTEKIKVHSDVYIALRAVGEAECPCVAVCSTGSMAVAQDKNGNMCKKGFCPEHFASSNIDGGDEINNKLVAKYKNEIKHL